MNKYKQDTIELGDVLCPRIKHDSEYYYPLRFIYEKILLKGKQNTNSLKKKGYNDDLVQFKIDFSYKDGGIQNTYCISESGLVRLLNDSYIGGLTVEQKKGMNFLLEHLGQDLINEEPRFVDFFDYEKSKDYSEYEKDCIKETLRLNKKLQWQYCKDCGKYYPLHSNFFHYNNKHNTFHTYCHNCRCEGKISLIHPDTYLNNIYNRYGEDIYIDYKNHNTIAIYNNYIENNLCEYPECIKNKDDYLTIIKYLHSSGKIDKDKLTLKYLTDEFRLQNINGKVSSNEIYKHLYRNHPNQYPWHYDKYYMPKQNINGTKIIFNNYLIENNIVVDDIYNFDYYDIARKSRIGKDYYKDILSFVMEYYDNQYPAYKFNIGSSNYWKEEKCRNQALKYLIEEDMKLELEKIPLYLTITSIRNISSTMYNVLKNYYANLFEWVNKVYPDVFNPKDFDINYMRNEFDSLDEQSIHSILKDNFNNVLYNPKHNEHTIKLLGKIPDWFIFTETGVTIIEYFGLWAKERGMYNTRTRDYIIRSKDKIEKYKTLQGYKFLYIYPEDLENDYEVLHKKIDDIKNNKKLNIVG